MSFFIHCYGVGVCHSQLCAVDGLEWDRQQARKFGLQSRYRKTMEAWEIESQVYRQWTELESQHLHDRVREAADGDDATNDSDVQSLLSVDEEENEEVWMDPVL